MTATRTQKIYGIDDGNTQVESDFHLANRASGATGSGGYNPYSASNNSNGDTDLASGYFRTNSGRVVRDANFTGDISSNNRGGLYRADYGETFHGLERTTNFDVPGPSWVRENSSGSFTYSFDSTGEPFWKIGNELSPIPIPYARPELAQLQGSALMGGVGSGGGNLLGDLAHGFSELIHGNVSPSAMAYGIYASSPVGMLVAASEDNYAGVGQRAGWIGVRSCNDIFHVLA